jgi:hypothetical protein
MEASRFRGADAGAEREETSRRKSDLRTSHLAQGKAKQFGRVTQAARCETTSTLRHFRLRHPGLALES